MSKEKTTFKTEELEAAVAQLYKLRLVHGWTGCLSLWHVPSCDKLIITQYPSSSNFIMDATRLTKIEDSFSWSDFLVDCGVHEEKNKVLLHAEDWADWHDDFATRGIKTHDGYYIIEQKNKSWFFDELDMDSILESVQVAALEELRNSPEKEIES